MIIKETGQVCEGFYMTGTPETPVYLLDGEEPVLFDAGLSADACNYIDGIHAVLGERQPGMIFLSHSHFDHIGAVSRFKKCWPEMKVAGSQTCAQILQKTKAVELIKLLNREGVEAIERMGRGPVNRDPFEPFSLDLLVADGQTIRLGPDLHVQVIGTPGHTWDLLSYWIPEKKF